MSMQFLSIHFFWKKDRDSNWKTFILFRLEETFFYTWDKLIFVQCTSKTPLCSKLSKTTNLETPRRLRVVAEGGGRTWWKENNLEETMTAEETIVLFTFELSFLRSRQ